MPLSTDGSIIQRVLCDGLTGFKVVFVGTVVLEGQLAHAAGLHCELWEFRFCRLLELNLQGLTTPCKSRSQPQKRFLPPCDFNCDVLSPALVNACWAIVRKEMALKLLKEAEAGS